MSDIYEHHNVKAFFNYLLPKLGSPPPSPRVLLIKTRLILLTLVLVNKL